MEKKSKFLSFILRHKPSAANITVDKYGWANVSQIIQNTDITFQELQAIVETDEKGRYSFSEDLTKIRANQGHSIKVENIHKKAIPPTVLYHGTNASVLKTILKEGLSKMKRHHVHLSSDLETATIVGNRRKKDLVILQIDAKSMLTDNITFYISENGVWLVDHVHPKYLSIHVSTTSLGKSIP